jgi:hypothetical protein
MTLVGERNKGGRENVVPTLRTLTLELINIGAVILLMAYIGMVIIGYATEGPRYHFRFDASRPAASIKRMLVGLGVWFAAGVVRVSERAMNPLYEASAQVGDWIAERSSPETQERFRSRFM